MPKREHKILTVHEYGPAIEIKDAAYALGMDSNEFWTGLVRTLHNVNPDLTNGCIETIGLKSFRFVGVAGIVAINQYARIEIVPKFLDLNSQAWRDDFLTIALLTRQGHLFEQLPIAARESENFDLYEIIAESWIHLFEKNRRTLIRNYVVREWSDFVIDGEVDEENLQTPTDLGFRQRGLTLSRSNYSNQLLITAAQYLLKTVTNPSNINRISNAVNTLRTAAKPTATKRFQKLNVRRNTPWLPILQLSETIVSNRTLGFEDIGQAFLPGYLIRTPIAWERLMYHACHKGFPHYLTRKRKFELGQRINPSGSYKTISIWPDIAIESTSKLELILDAKYKTSRDAMGSSKNAVVSIADIYEALSYLKVTSTNLIILLYPGSGPLQATDSSVLETFQDLEGNRVIALDINVQGIARNKGFSLLSNIVRSKIDGFINSAINVD